MGKRGKKKNEIVNLKKRLIALEQKYGFNYNSQITPGISQEQDSPVYQKAQDYSEEQTNSHPERTTSIEIESIKNTIDSKVSEIRGEFREESTYVKGRFDSIFDLIRTEGISLRTMFISRTLFFWIVGLLVSILGAIGYFMYSRVDSDIHEVKDDLKEVKQNIQNLDIPQKRERVETPKNKKSR